MYGCTVCCVIAVMSILLEATSGLSGWGSTQLPTRTSTFVSTATRSTSVTVTVSWPNTVTVNTQLSSTTSTLASSKDATRGATRMSTKPTVRANDAFSTPIASTILSVLPRDYTKAMVTKTSLTSQIHTTQISSSSNSRQATTREATTLMTTDLDTIAHETKSSSSNHTLYASVAAPIGVIVVIASIISVFIVRRRRAGKSDFKTVRSHVAGCFGLYVQYIEISYANSISTISGAKSGSADDADFRGTATFPANRRHEKSNNLCDGSTFDIANWSCLRCIYDTCCCLETSDDLQLNPLYSDMALQHRMTKNFLTAASHKDSRGDMMTILYQSADQGEKTAARESENVIYNM